MVAVTKQVVPARRADWGFLKKRIIPEKYVLRWSERQTQREYEKELQKAKATGKRDDVEEVEHYFDYTMMLHNQEQEVLYTEQLLKRGRRFRIHIPSMPDYSEGRNEDWEMADFGKW